MIKNISLIRIGWRGNIFRFKFIAVGIVLCLLFFNISYASSKEGASWTFVVFGDTRDASEDTATGVSPYLPVIAQGIAAEKPDFVIHTGDLINGYYTKKDSPIRGKYAEMFHNWKTAMKPVYNYAEKKGIPIYTVRGNHEDGKIFTDSTLKKAYIEAFGVFMPQNGPDDEKGLTYSFTHKRAKLIAVDQYKGSNALTKGKVPQAWLDRQLGDSHNAFTFVFGHTPAYKVSSVKMSVSPRPLLLNHVSERDVFWESFKKAGVSMYFAGHVHFYCRGIKDSIMQVVVGNGGANMVDFDPEQVDPALTLKYPLAKVKREDMMVGYLVVMVDEAARTIKVVQKLWNADTNKWETGDNFTMQ